MCLAVPVRIVEKNGVDAVSELDGIKRRVRLDLMPDVETGDYVIVHAGFAIERLDEKRALENLKAIREVADALR